MTPRIQRAIDIFLDAINNGTLAKGICAKCAVGNLCGGNGAWAHLFITIDNRQTLRNGDIPTFHFHKHPIDIKMGLEAISVTEFTESELAKIEYAFETNSKIDIDYYEFYSKEEIRADQIKGLEAVIKVMLEFDDCKEDDIKEIFTEKADLIPIL